MERTPINPAYRNRYSNYRRDAEKRGFSFNISLEEFITIVSQDCTYCGSPPAQIRKHHNHAIIYNGVDRIDNSRGYETGNVVPCCQYCNFAKGTLSVTQFKTHIERMYHHMTGQGPTITALGE